MDVCPGGCSLESVLVYVVYVVGGISVLVYVCSWKSALMYVVGGVSVLVYLVGSPSWCMQLEVSVVRSLSWCM